MLHGASTLHSLDGAALVCSEAAPNGVARGGGGGAPAVVELEHAHVAVGMKFGVPVDAVPSWGSAVRLSCAAECTWLLAHVHQLGCAM